MKFKLSSWLKKKKKEELSVEEVNSKVEKEIGRWVLWSKAWELLSAVKLKYSRLLNTAEWQCSRLMSAVKWLWTKVKRNSSRTLSCHIRIYLLMTKQSLWSTRQKTNKSEWFEILDFNQSAIRGWEHVVGEENPGFVQKSMVVGEKNLHSSLKKV